jgi:hypothetical protein
MGSSPGAPRQVNLRRSVSTAYYGVFHTLLSAAADTFVGVSRRSTNAHELAYRSIDHGPLRDTCKRIQDKPSNFSLDVPPNGFGPGIRTFAAAVFTLSLADYIPSYRPTKDDVVVPIRQAQTAAQWLQQCARTRTCRPLKPRCAVEDETPTPVVSPRIGSCLLRSAWRRQLSSALMPSARGRRFHARGVSLPTPGQTPWSKVTSAARGEWPKWRQG